MLKVRVINPEEIVFEGEASYVLAPGTSGHLGIFPSHAPLYAELTAGELVIHGSEEKAITIERGILRVRSDELTILIGL